MPYAMRETVRIELTLWWKKLAESGLILTGGFIQDLQGVGKEWKYLHQAGTTFGCDGIPVAAGVDDDVYPATGQVSSEQYGEY